MSIITGGVLEDWGQSAQALRAVMNAVRDFAPRTSDDDYAVDIAFRSWHKHREPEFQGVEPAMVGRKQRRFIIWHSVPKGLETPEQVRDWLVGVLPQTAELVRDYLPRKSKSYPSEELAVEVDALRTFLASRTFDIEAVWQR